jgi:uncharacterized alkaline shock family protein YloU
VKEKCSEGHKDNRLRRRVTVTSFVLVSYGYSITSVAKEIQNAVISAVEP